MKVEAQQKSPTEHVVKVEIPQDIVAKKLEALYRKFAREIELPGFRRGKVPRSFLEARFGKDFLYEDAQAELISERLPEALQELKLEPVATPKTTVIEFERDKPFTFEASVEVLPQIDVRDYLGVELEDIPKKQVDQKGIEAALEMLRLEHGTLVPKSLGRGPAVAEAGDVALLLRKVRGREEEFQLRLDPQQELSKKLIGKGVGDEIELELDEGQRGRLKILALKSVELPDDQELASILGHASVEQLRSSIQSDLERSAEEERVQRLKVKLLDVILERNPVPVPPRMVDELVIRDAEALKRQGVDLTDEQIAEHKKRVEQRLKRDLILNAIKKKEDIKLSDEEFSEFLKQEAQKQGINELKFKALLEQQGRLESLRTQLEQERVMELIYKSAVIEG